MDSEHRLALPKGTVINQYRIESVLGYGGFGIVYKAQHMRLGNWLAIKEYLPQELATRESGTVHPLGTREEADFQTGLDRFLAEAKQLVQFENHPNIVNCQDFIEDNGTAYLVMGFEDGLPLSDLIRGRERNNQSFSENELRRIMLPLLRGLAVVHKQNVLHRDIKPGNIFIRRSDEQPVLIDFGAAKQNFTEHSKSMAPYSPGYAAIEQVESDGNLGPWTDIYAIGGVMWRIIAKQNPPQVENRMSAATRNRPDPLTPAVEIGAGRYSENFLKTVDKCLCLNEEDRFQSVDEVIRSLQGEQAGTAASSTPEAATAKSSSKIKRPPPAAGDSSTTGRNAIFAVLIVAVLGGGGYFAYDFFSSQQASTAQELLIADLMLQFQVDRATVEDAIAQGQSSGTSPQQILQELADATSAAEQARARESLIQDLMDQFSVDRATAENAITQAGANGGSPQQVLRDRADRIAANDDLLQALAGLGNTVTIPAGFFDMGDLDGTGDADEAPVHSVFLDEFELMEHEITFAQWDACVDARACARITDRSTGRRELRPVTNASWDQAQSYINWLNGQPGGGGWRLPTEAEWEYAARADGTTSYHWGNTHQCALAKLDNCGEAGTTEVMQYPANDWGLYDMHGNASEWVQDCARDNYNGAPDDGSAWAGAAGCSRVLRGGGWDSSAHQGRISFRNWMPANQSSASSGFRLAR